MTEKSNNSNNSDASNNYQEEAKAKWSSTKEHTQSIEKTSHYTKEDWDSIHQERDDIFKAFANLMDNDHTENEADELVVKWKMHITKHYYECTDDMLAGLADMYINDDRFKVEIDKYKKGLTDFISDAIKTYYINAHQ